jgi:hypothetical protein
MPPGRHGDELPVVGEECHRAALTPPRVAAKPFGARGGVGGERPTEQVTLSIEDRPRPSPSLTRSRMALYIVLRLTSMAVKVPLMRTGLVWEDHRAEPAGIGRFFNDVK